MGVFTWRLTFCPGPFHHLSFFSELFLLRPREFPGLQTSCRDSCSQLSSSEEAVVDLWSDCNKRAELSASCVGLIFTSLVSIFDPSSAGELKVQHWQSPLYQCKATYSGMLLGFPEAPLNTHYPCAMPFTPPVRIKASHT
jgi:hypothetical protein